MHNDTLELRQPTADPETLRAFLHPVAVAFGDDYTDEMFELDRQLFEMDRLIGAVDGDTWVGGATGESRRLTVPGGAEVRAAAVSGVGVLPTHRRRGILTSLMRWLLEQAAERGEPVSVLHASEGAIYPHFGYGLATLQGSIDVDRSAFRFSRPAGPLGQVRLVDVDEAMRTIPAIYDQVRAGRPGEVSRSPNVWRLQLLSDNSWRRAAMGPKSNAVLTVDGEPRGYALYRVKAEWGDRGPKNTLNVAGGDRPRSRRRAGAVGMAGRHRPRDPGQGLADARPQLAAPAGRRAPAARADDPRRDLAAAGRRAGGARGADATRGRVV